MAKRVLATRAATENDFEYVWRVYSDAVEPLIGPHLKQGWHNAVEVEKFQKMWNAADSHIIMVDNHPVGWIGVVISDHEILVEHLYVEASHRGKGYGIRLVSEMTKQWTQQGKTVRASVLKDERAMKLVSHLGFENAADESDHSLTQLFTYTKK